MKFILTLAIVLVLWTGLGIGVLIQSKSISAVVSYFEEKSALAQVRTGDTVEARERLKSVVDIANSFAIPEENKSNSLLHLGNIAYELWDFAQAREYYSRSKPDRIEAEFRRLHNLGNTDYRIGEQARDKVSRILSWGSAIAEYEKALEWKEDVETRENLEFVKKKMKEESQPEQQSGGNESSWSTAQWSGSQSGQTASGSTGSGQTSGERPPQSWQIWRNTGDFDRIGGSSGNQESDLSDSERSILEGRMDSIEELGKTGQEYLRRDGKPSQWGESTFFSTLQQFESGQNGVEKDW